MSKFEQQQEQKQTREESFRENIGLLFDKIKADPSGYETIVEGIRRLVSDPVFTNEHPDFDVDEMMLRLEKASEFEDKKAYVDEVVDILTIVFAFREKNPVLCEDVEALHSMKECGFTPLNERVSYGASEGIAHFHLAPSWEVKAKLPELFLNGMFELAKVVKDDESIETVTGTSWLVATNTYGTMFKEMGFEIGEVTAEFKAKFFPDEEREVKKATMKREAFLKKYGDE